MNHEIYEKELEEIRNKINKLEVEEAKSDWKSSSWYGKIIYGKSWPDKPACLVRKASWQTLKKDIERKMELVRENSYLVSKFSTQLSKVEEKINQLEARLAELQDREEKSKLGEYLLFAVIIILLIFFLFLIATGRILSDNPE